MAKRTATLDKEEERSLFKRYLFWLYKTTKDELDKVDRKFTQLALDRKLLVGMSRDAAKLDPAAKKGIEPFLREWKAYISKKEEEARRLKFTPDKTPLASYRFLCLKQEAVVRLIREMFGKKALRKIRKLYEDFSVERIMQDTSGRR